jgi:hypothetical protein
LTKSSRFLEYMKIHLISLKQDIETNTYDESEFHDLSGQIKATEHLLSVATDIMNESERIYS